jgi:imidazolonepropionase-like amidohydrolase
MRMPWHRDRQPVNKELTRGQEAAAEAAREAEESFQNVVAAQPGIEATAAAFRRMREENHFAEMLREAFGARS